MKLNQYADFELSKDRARGLDEAIIRQRIINLGKSAVEDGVDAFYTLAVLSGTQLMLRKSKLMFQFLDQMNQL